MNLDNQVDPNPHAIIVCNDLEKYAEFAALLEKNGYPARTVQNMPEEVPRPGTVYFVSFNLQSTNAVFLAKQIESQGMICIVFAEEPGVQTAAKLSSAKMTQTLQHPYTQKNFVMAVQTIVKNRKAQFEKDLRKKQHDERLKSQQKTSGPAANAGIIIQEGAKQVTDDSAKVFKGESSENFSATQSGRSFKGFFAKQESPEQVTEKSTMVFKADQKEKVTIVHSGQTTKGFFAIQENAKPTGAKEKTEHESVTLDYSKLKEKPAAPAEAADAQRSRMVRLGPDAAGRRGAVLCAGSGQGCSGGNRVA